MKSSLFSVIAFGVFMTTALMAPRASAQFIVDAPTEDAELTTANVTLATQAGLAAKTATSAAETVDKLGQVEDAIGSGITTFGNLSFQPDDSLPGDAKSTLNLMKSSGTASNIARTIQSGASSLGKAFFNKVKPFAKNTLSDDMDSAASAMAANEDIYADAKQHTATLEKLRAQIATTVNLKQAADLQARIQVENADIANEMVKVQALENMEEHNDKVRQVQTKQSLFGRDGRSY